MSFLKKPKESMEDMDDLPELVARLCKDDEIFGSRSSTDSSEFGNSSKNTELEVEVNMMAIALPCKSEDSLDQSLRQIWPMEPKHEPNNGLNFPLGLNNCWNFPDIMALQRINVDREQSLSSSSSSSSMSTGEGTTSVVSSKWSPAPCNSRATELEVKKALIEDAAFDEIVKMIEVGFSNDVDNTISEKFRVYRLHPGDMVGRQSVFFVEALLPTTTSNMVQDSLSLFQIEITRPDGKKSVLHLRPDSDQSHPRRFFCSFSPTETGEHILSVCIAVAPKMESEYSFRLPGSDTQPQHINGSPLIILPSRYYPNSNGFNIVRMGFNPCKMFCLKAWGIGVYRPKNLIYIADRENNEVVILDSSPRIISKFGSKGFLPGQFCRPTGVAVDHVHQRVIISDKDNHRIAVFDLKGNFLFQFGSKGHLEGTFNYPWGVAVSPDGKTIAVADSRNFRIQCFDSNGNFLRKYSVFETNPFEYREEFNYPRGIAFSLDGSQIYVTDFNIQAAFVINAELTTKQVFIVKGAMKRPQGIAVDEAGNVLIADSKNNCIRVVDSTGKLIYTFTGSGKESFNCPLDVAVLNGGRVAVIDRDNRFRIF